MWLQDLIIALAVSACVVFVAREAWRVLHGKASMIGSCCSKGCGSSSGREPKPGTPAQPAGVQFIPLESLSRTRPRR